MLRAVVCFRGGGAKESWDQVDVGQKSKLALPVPCQRQPAGGAAEEA